MNTASLNYKGLERRRSLRRLSNDRRAMLRWEPDKDDRRSRRDRRQSATDLWSRNFER